MKNNDMQEVEYHIIRRQLNGAFARDPWVYINVEFKDGRIIARNTGKPLELAEGTQFQIRLSSSKAYGLRLESRAHFIPFINKSCSIFYGVRRFYVTQAFESGWIWKDGLIKQYELDPSVPVRLTKRETADEYLWTEIKLRENLWLAVRGDKDAKLLPCVVNVPSSERDFPSLNSAVTACVKEMQPNRKSTSTNVFRNCIAKIDDVLYGFEYLRLNALGPQAPPFEPFRDEPKFLFESRMEYRE